MSGHEICPIPFQADNKGEDQIVSFQFNDTAIKIGRELNARRNVRFSAGVAKRINNVLSDYLYLQSMKIALSKI